MADVSGRLSKAHRLSASTGRYSRRQGGTLTGCWATGQKTLASRGCWCRTTRRRKWRGIGVGWRLRRCFGTSRAGAGILGDVGCACVSGLSGSGGCWRWRWCGHRGWVVGWIGCVGVCVGGVGCRWTCRCGVVRWVVCGCWDGWVGCGVGAEGWLVYGLSWRRRRVWLRCWVRCWRVLGGFVGVLGGLQGVCEVFWAGFGWW